MNVPRIYNTKTQVDDNHEENKPFVNIQHNAFNFAFNFNGSAGGRKPG